MTSNLKKISFLFFLVLTGAHLASTLLLAQGLDNKLILLANQTLDLPAIFAGILYAFASLKEYAEHLGRDTKPLDMAAGAIGGVVFLGVLYLNFLA